MRYSIILCFLSSFSLSVFAQENTYLYTIAPAVTNENEIFVHYGAAYGEQTFEPFGGDKIEQNLGVNASIGSSLTVLAHVGLALNDGSSHSMQHGELLMSFLNGDSTYVDFSAGAGMRHEYGGTNVILARGLIGKRFRRWQINGNVLLEKALSSDRDEIDLMTTFGVSYNFSSTIHAGLEAVGQDLEGFWDDEEAEGGAVIFFGPTVGMIFPESKMHVTLGGGPIIRATTSNSSSDAVRDFPVTPENGYVVRTTVSIAL